MNVQREAGMDPPSFPTYAAWFDAAIRNSYPSVRQAALGLRLSQPQCWALLRGRSPGWLVIDKIADGFEVERTQLVPWRADATVPLPRELASTIDVVEAERIHRGLKHQEVAATLALSPAEYRRFRAGQRLSLEQCIAVVRWAGVAPDLVLKWEGHWDRLSLYGRLMATSMLQLGYDERELARVSSAPLRRVRSALYGRHSPLQRWLKTWAAVLSIDFWVLRDLVKRAHPSRGPDKRIRRQLRHEGRALYEEQGRRLAARQVKLTTRERRSADSIDRALPAQRAHWANASHIERLRYAALHLNPILVAASASVGAVASSLTAEITSAFMATNATAS